MRLGSAHGDVKDIGSLFFSPSKVRVEVEAPPLEPEFAEDFPTSEDPASADEPEAKPRASWLDAVSVQGDHGVPAARDSAFNPDDNGLYRMYLPETA